MWYLVFKSALSGIIVMAVSEIARRYPAAGALVASLPLVSILGMLWLWHDTHDTGRLAAHAGATFWMVLPSLPMFLLLPYCLHRGVPFYPALAVSCLLTAALYLLMVWAFRHFGVAW